MNEWNEWAKRMSISWAFLCGSPFFSASHGTSTAASCNLDPGTALETSFPQIIFSMDSNQLLRKGVGFSEGYWYFLNENSPWSKHVGRAFAYQSLAINVSKSVLYCPRTHNFSCSRILFNVYAKGYIAKLSFLNSRKNFLQLQNRIVFNWMDQCLTFTNGLKALCPLCWPLTWLGISFLWGTQGENWEWTKLGYWGHHCCIIVTVCLEFLVQWLTDAERDIDGLSGGRLATKTFLATSEVQKSDWTKTAKHCCYIHWIVDGKQFFFSFRMCLNVENCLNAFVL